MEEELLQTLEDLNMDISEARLSLTDLLPQCKGESILSLYKLGLVSLLSLVRNQQASPIS
jgi:hypothetical protein